MGRKGRERRTEGDVKVGGEAKGEGRGREGKGRGLSLSKVTFLVTSLLTPSSLWLI